MYIKRQTAGLSAVLGFDSVTITVCQSEQHNGPSQKNVNVTNHFLQHVANPTQGESGQTDSYSL